MNIARPVLFAIAALGLIGAAPVRVADPMKMLNYLVGRWNCSSTVGGTTTTYAADYTYALGGKWIRHDQLLEEVSERGYDDVRKSTLDGRGYGAYRYDVGLGCYRHGRGAHCDANRLSTTRFNRHVRSSHEEEVHAEIRRDAGRQAGALGRHLHQGLAVVL